MRKPNLLQIRICHQCCSSPTLGPAEMLTAAPLMVIYKKRFRRYATPRGRMAFKTKILIADTILAEQARS